MSVHVSPDQRDTDQRGVCVSLVCPWPLVGSGRRQSPDVEGMFGAAVAFLRTVYFLLGDFSAARDRN